MERPETESTPSLGSEQDENGTDLGLLRRHLALSVEERLLLLERQLQFATELRRAAIVAVKTPS